MTKDEAFKKLPIVLAQCVASADKITAEQMLNAMKNIDKIAPCFGRGLSEYLVINGSQVVSGVSCPTYAPITKDVFLAFLSDKSQMIDKHIYAFAA